MNNALLHSPVSSPSQCALDQSKLSYEEMELLSDELLAGCVRLGKASGIYTQAQLDRKVRNERKRIERVTEDCASAPMIESVIDSQLNDLIDAAGLNAIEEIVCRLYVAGFTGRRIAQVLGIRRRVVKQRLRIVKRRIRAAYLQGPYAGWYEVYLSEVNRLTRRAQRY
ncbi:MAG: hypothetical protein GX139_06010 [Armatimonadetes bacterium]|jgi:DNA-binding NarL/FixJ family response regulator|nr:hypothetical protein [Armatimonadota bacterium]